VSNKKDYIWWSGEGLAASQGCGYYGQKWLAFIFIYLFTLRFISFLAAEARQ